MDLFAEDKATVPAGADIAGDDGSEAELLRRLQALEKLIQEAVDVNPQGMTASAAQWVRDHEAETRARMEAIGAAIHAFLVSRPPAEAVARAYAAVTSRLRAWSSTSPVFHHIYHVPRHRLDTFEIADLVMSGRPGGADLPGYMMDYFYLNTVAARSFRLRTQWLGQILQNEIRARLADRHQVRILNLHTGSARELDVVIRDRALRSHVHLTCLDTDAAGLRRVRDRLEPQFGGRVAFQLGDPRKVTASRLWPDAPYDIIYALVLCDQLSDRQVAPLIANCARGLRPGGILILGNYASTLPDSEFHLIHWVLDFNIRRRDEATLRALFDKAPFGADGVHIIEPDPWRASYLVTAPVTAPAAPRPGLRTSSGIGPGSRFR